MGKAEELSSCQPVRLVWFQKRTRTRLSASQSNTTRLRDHIRSNFPPKITDSSIRREKLGQNGQNCLAAIAQQGLAVCAMLTSSRMKCISAFWWAIKSSKTFDKSILQDICGKSSVLQAIEELGAQLQHCVQHKGSFPFLSSRATKQSSILLPSPLFISLHLCRDLDRRHPSVRRYSSSVIANIPSLDGGTKRSGGYWQSEWSLNPARSQGRWDGSLEDTAGAAV